MGVDLMFIGGGVSFNWTSWDTLYDLGVAFGWRPAGTLPMTGQPDDEVWSYPDDDDRETPRGDYFSNDFQRVTEMDAAAWCAALGRALAALEGKSPMTLEEAEAVRRIWAEANDDWLGRAIAAFEELRARPSDDEEPPTHRQLIHNAIAASKKQFYDRLDDEEPPTPEQLEERRQCLEPLIRAFVKRVKPCRGFAIG